MGRRLLARLGSIPKVALACYAWLWPLSTGEDGRVLTWQYSQTSEGSATLPASSRQGCFCLRHINGRPVKATCRYLDATIYGDSGARALLPAEDKFCLPLAEFCAAGGALAGAANGGGCVPAPAPIANHAALNMVKTKCDSAQSCAALVAPVAPAPVLSLIAPLFFDAFRDPQKVGLSRQYQTVMVRCPYPCTNTSTIAFLAVNCSGGPQSADNWNGSVVGPLTGIDPEFSFEFERRYLENGQHYHICVDPDGAGNAAYSTVDSNLQAYISGVVEVEPTTVSIAGAIVDMTVTCDSGGCGYVSSGYLAKYCYSKSASDYEGQREAVPGMSTESAFFTDVQLQNQTSTWYEAQRLASSDMIAGARLGASASVTGEFSLFGAPMSAGGVGEAYLFERSLDFVANGPKPNQWQQVMKLEPPAGNHTGARFGTSVEVHGLLAVVGAPHRSDDLVTDSTGAVHVYGFSVGGGWELKQTLKGNEEKGYWLGQPDRFGSACSLSDRTLAIGAPTSDEGTLDGGTVFVFAKDPLGIWAKKQFVCADDPAYNDLFGRSVSVWGSVLVVGAEGKAHGAATGAGQAYVYNLTDGVNGTWIQVGKLLVSGETNGRFGAAVAVSSSRFILVGEPGAAYYQGALHVYSEAIPFSGVWSLKVRIAGPVASSMLGAGVGITGHTAVATAPGDGPKGAVHIYNWDGTAWTWTQKLVPGYAQAAVAGFGTRVGTGTPLSVEAGRLAVGAPYADGGAVSGFGAGLVYELPATAVELTMAMDVSALVPGESYKLCTDLDGYKTDLRFGDTGLVVQVQP
ncbi:unnamed protein product [Polarella glacialis]|uniref:Uncharacterized protein n=1 Tax=Polarella glacialis TaxID=89957 RepID=A0A813GS70_POLGL|nr:unnamed protein product [Polarella glacialis]